MYRIRSFMAALCFLLLLPVFASATPSQTTDPVESSTSSQQSLTKPATGSVLPLQTPLAIEDSLTGLENLLDNWETDSIALLRQLVELQATVQALKSTLTQSETLAQDLATSLYLERQKTQSLRKWLTISISGGVVVSIVAFCLGAYSSP